MLEVLSRQKGLLPPPPPPPALPPLPPLPLPGGACHSAEPLREAVGAEDGWHLSKVEGAGVCFPPGASSCSHHFAQQDQGRKAGKDERYYGLFSICMCSVRQCLFPH
jgi:hypothetical protein